MRIKAYKDHRRKKTYTMFSYKRGDDTVYITTCDNNNPYSRVVTSNELNNLKRWLKERSTEDDVMSFDNFQDDVYVDTSISNPDTVHFRSKVTGNYMFTYVPVAYVNDM